MAQWIIHVTVGLRLNTEGMAGSSSYLPIALFLMVPLVQCPKSESWDANNLYLLGL